MRRIVQAALVAAGLAASGLAHAQAGKEIYEKTCALCHAGGLAGAPRRFLSHSQIVFPSGVTGGARTSLFFQPGQLLGLYLVANGSTADALAGNANVWFTFDAANSDGGLDHEFRFEDLAGLGDADYNDADVTISRTPALVPIGQPGQTLSANFVKLPTSDKSFRGEVGLIFDFIGIELGQ